MANQKIEKRSAATELRAEGAGDALVLVGRALSYNMLSRDLGGFVEQIAPGCFARTLADSNADVKALFNHDPNQILGRRANGTLALEDRADGLYFRVQLNPASQAHRDLHAAVKRQDVSECSFAFTDVQDSFDTVQLAGVKVPRRTVRSATLMDCSPVVYPAYAGNATAVQARSFDYGTASTPGKYSAQEVADLLRQLEAMPGDWANQERAHEIGKQMLRSLKLDDSYDVDGTPRSIEDFLSSRIAKKFGPSKMGHASRYQLKEVEVSAKGPGKAMAGVCHAYDFDAVPMGNVRFRFLVDANAQVEFSDPENDEE